MFEDMRPGEHGTGLFRSAAALIPALLAAGASQAAPATTPIQHVIIIMQENRSFDSYFGTYPGADGIPPGTCVPIDPARPALGCVVPYHDPNDVEAGAPHGNAAAMADIDNGLTAFAMDGFIAQQMTYIPQVCAKHPTRADCNPANSTGLLRHDVMGYHTAAEIPNYWAYAQHFVLQDRLFEGTRGYSIPSHYELTSEWSATCTSPTNALSCTTDADPENAGKKTMLPWVSLFQFLDVHGVSWKYYVGIGQEPDCMDGKDDCPPQIQTTGGIFASGWNPPGLYAYVKLQGAAYLAAHDADANQLLVDIGRGNLPEVSWLVPSLEYSEHLPQPSTTGMMYVTSIVNAVMQSPYWRKTAIFVTWDDWGGKYDHVVPPNVDYQSVNPTVFGYGLRVPGLMISAWAKPGLIDHQLLSFDNYAKLMEDLFAGGAGLNPADFSNPDSRPDLRDRIRRVTFPDGHVERVGDLINEFDFTQTPNRPLILDTHVPVNLGIACRKNTDDHTATCTKHAVTISWSSLTGPQIPEMFTYHVLRDGVRVPQCAGPILTCIDTPPAGTHFYTIYSVDPKGVVSPTSAAAQADAIGP